MAGKKPKKPVEPTTWDGWCQQEWAAFERYRADWPTCSEPSFTFQVGEEVRMGNRPGPILVHQVLEAGKTLLLSVPDKGETYGNPWDNHRCLPVFARWFEVNALTRELPTAFHRPRSRTTYMQMALDSLLHRVYSRGLLDNPDYQRDYVWTLADKQRLIESIFNRADIGKFIFISSEHTNKLEVVDGKQRLLAIREFYESRFEFRGVTYAQLSKADKFAFRDIMVQSCDLQDEYTKKSDILWLFLTVNSAGVPQTEEHIARIRAMYEQALTEEANNA